MGRDPHSVQAVNLGADYTDEEREFLAAIDAYKRLHRRPFPTLCEILDVVHGLGYRRPGFDDTGSRTHEQTT